MRALPPSIRQFGRVALTATVLLTSLVATFEQGTVSATAEPAGSTSDAAEAVELDANMASTTLYGRDATVTLNAVNTTPSDAFNLSFSAVLPTSVAYVDGSSRVGDVGSGDPVVVRGADSTVLVWSNRSDLLAGASSSLSFAVRPDTSVYGVGDDIEVAAVAAANSDPRTVPDFDPVTGDPAADATSSAASAVSTRLSPFDLTVSEPSEERELLRGVHDHRTVVTVALDNNLVQPTTGFSITTHLPAGLEFLGCGDVDNSTPGTEEYSGAGPLNADGAPAMANLCLTPSSVSTLTVDPDGEGTLGRGTQTQLVWDASALSAAFGSADLDAGDSLRFDFVVAVPLRSNVEAELAEPTANLDNNTGPLTSDEQAMVVHGVATGDYAGALPSADEATETIVAEDVSVHVRTSTASIEQGGSTTWSLLVESSEYALTTGPITVTDVVPDGLDVVGSAPSVDSGFPAGQADGKTVLTWTLGGFDAPNGVATITYDTVARTDYRATGLPVMSRDTWADSASLVSTSAVLSAADGTTLPLETPDSSSKAQTAGGPAINKSVAAPVTADGSCGDGTGLATDDDVAGPFHPGDRVCWRLTVEFPGALDTRDVVVHDYLPAGFRYESHTPTASDTIADLAQLSDTAPLLEWDLGDIDAGGQRFDVVVQTVVDDPTAGHPADLRGNLLKVRHRNTAGQVFQYRDDADASWGEAVVHLSAGVVEVDDVAVAGAPADAVAVEAGDVVTLALTVDNTAGSAAALNVDVRGALPAGLDCGDVSSVSEGGACSTSGPWIEWPAGLGIDVGVGASRELLFDVTVPAGITAGVSLPVDAGVRTYEGATNTGTPFVYIPTGNIDPTLEANTSAARDAATIATSWPTVDLSRTTSISGSGNSQSNQATIGETISYTIDVVLPSGTTFYGPANISDELGTRLDLDEATVVAALDGGPIPSDWMLSTVGNEVLVSLGESYAVPLGTDQLVEISFDAVVTDVGANVRPSRARTSAQLTWEDEAGAGRNRRDSVNAQIVEPNLSVAKSHDDVDGVLQSGQQVTYTVSVVNADSAQVATAHDVVVVDTVPAELTVLGPQGEPATTGDRVGSGAGRFDAASRTITWELPALAVGEGAVVDYDVRSADPLVASTTVTNTVSAFATSMAGDADGERGPDSNHGGFGSGYRADAAKSITAPVITLARTLSPTIATIGESVDHTLVVTIPAKTVAADVTVFDELAPGLRFDELSESSCEAGGEPCTPDIAVLTAMSGGSGVAFFLGDVASPALVDREVTLTYRSHVIDVVAAKQGAELTSTASVRHNAADAIDGVPSVMPTIASFDHVSASADATVTVVEPVIAVDSSVAGQIGDTDRRRAVPGETLTYTIVVSNDDGSAVGPAHDVVVTEIIDGRLESFVDLTVASGVVALDSDHVDGTLSWKIAGPIAPGDSVALSYEVTVPSDWTSADELSYGAEVVSRADVAVAHGVDAVTRAEYGGREFREYTDVLSDVVLVEADLASIGDRVWFDADRDRSQDSNESGAEGVEVTVVYHGADGALGTDDDESHETLTGPNGIWTVESLPGGRFTMLVDRSGLPAGMTPTMKADRDLGHADAVWSGWLNQNHDLRTADAGFADPPANTGLGFDEGAPATDSTGNVWVVGLKPDGRAYVRSRSPENAWSSWLQQGAGGWASMTVNTDRAGNVWVAGVKNSGAAYVRTKDATLGIRDGWSQWVQQGSGGWSSMALATDPSGSVWLAGVKLDGNTYVRTKLPGGQIGAGWSTWVHQGLTAWSAMTLATDSAGNVWVSGVSNAGAAYVRRKQAGGDVGDGWSSWARQGGSTGWVSMNLATDSQDNLWLAGVKESGTALVRMKSDDPSIRSGWSSWHQLGSSNSWASMTLTVDDIDTLWIAGVKHSGTAYIAMKCYCPGVSEGWSRWWQQGSVNSWHSLTISTDPSNRVMLAGRKLSGTGFVRIKGVDSGVSTAWSLWKQQGSSFAWQNFDPHSAAWAGVQPPRTPTMGITDVEWINAPGWTDAMVSVNSSGTMYWC